MTRKRHRTAGDEIGAIRKSWRGKIRIALVYPNRYAVGMSNLGFQMVYDLFNRCDSVVCERAFLPDQADQPVKTIETRRAVDEFDIIAFSISFENDYPHLLSILLKEGIPPSSASRGDHHPLLVAGGVACMINPEPIAAFFDCFFIGEAEAIVPGFIQSLKDFGPDFRSDRSAFLKLIARNVPGTYVPAFYETRYHTDGTIQSFDPIENVPDKIQHVRIRNLSDLNTCSKVLAPGHTFGETFLIETGRGCPHGCRFCCAGYIYRPPRFRPASAIEPLIDTIPDSIHKIGLVSAAVSDMPDIESLCQTIGSKNFKISFSSLRADSITSDLVPTLKQCGMKTATIAPDAGSQRMRNVINKGISEQDVLNAAEVIVKSGIPNLKLYFMIGLPTETDADVDAIIELCLKVKETFLNQSRKKGRIGTITVSLNPFVPKPLTPFQWAPMNPVSVLKKKTEKVLSHLKKIPNVRMNSGSPRQAYVQTLLSRGDRRVAEMLLNIAKHSHSPYRLMTSSDSNTDFYVYRDKSVDMDEILPWDFIDHGIRKSFLKNEYLRAMEAKTTQPCPMIPDCDICGACSKDKR